MPYTFHMLPNILVTNDFLIRKEVLEHLPIPMLLVSPSREVLWSNRYAQWFQPDKEDKRRMLVQVTAHDMHQRIPGVRMRSGSEVTAESHPVRNLAGRVEAYLVWISDNLSGMAGDFLQTGIAVAENGKFVLANHTARLLLGENVAGGSWDQLAWLPRWHVVLRRGHRSTFAMVRDAYEVRIHSHYPWVVLEAVPNSIIEQNHMALSFAASVMHEVRNPLAALSGFIEMAQVHQAPGPGTEYLQRAMQEVDRLARLTGDFMAMSRSTELSPQWCQAAAVLEKAWTVVLAGTPQNAAGLRLETQFSPEETVFADPDRLQQVFINVLKNSVEAMSAAGIVTVAIGHDERGQHIRIADNGPGIPEEVLDALFVQRRTTKESGHGLGLLIIKQLVEAHGGQVSIASEVGLGTQVMLTLPYPARLGAPAL